MAKESFDKEIQFLRMLALTSGAYSRQQFADRLGISVHTFDKTLKRLKEIVGTVHQQLPDEQGKELAETIRYNYFDSSDPMLLFLFRAKSLKESESERISILLAAVKEQALTAMELLDICCGSLPAEQAPPDEKTIRSDLKYLEQVGVICKEPGPRPYRYRLHNGWLTELTEDERLDLYDFVDVMANTGVPSLQGYLLRDSLKRQLLRGRQDKSGQEGLDVFLYKYHYYSRLLDEAHLFALLAAIERRMYVSFLYFSPKKNKSYASQNTNPLFERDSEGVLERALPLKVVYDHQYGRWYLLANHSHHSIRKYRIEGITQIADDGDCAPEELFAAKLAELEDKIAYSWLIDTGRRATVKLRFFNPGAGVPNFVKERVLQQGQWGRIVQEDELSFLYEIEVNGTLEIKPWVRSFGSSCEVLEPAHLRRELIEEWKELKSYYEHESV